MTTYAGLVQPFLGLAPCATLSPNINEQGVPDLASFDPADPLISSAPVGPDAIDVAHRLYPYPGVQEEMGGHEIFYKIHIVLNESPELGFVLSSKQVDLEVWNAYKVAKLLSSIDKINSEGVTLVEPSATPLNFPLMSSKLYQVIIGVDGPPILGAEFIFHFPDEDPEVTFTGRRVVVWPFMPEAEHNEVLEWLTDLIQPMVGEQRIAMRAAPRQAFSYTFVLTEAQFSRAKAIATKWAHRVYGVPVWSEATHLGSLPIGTTDLVFDTSKQDYRSNDIILLWDSDLKAYAVECLTVTSGSVELKIPTEVALSDAFVAPLRFARAYGGITFERAARDEAISRATFTVSQNKDLGATVGYPVYRGSDVYVERTVLLSNVEERIYQTIDIFDNGSGIVDVHTKRDFPLSTYVASFDTLDRDARWSLRQWLHSRRGKQKSFWLPSWNRDLIVLQPVDSLDQSLIVEPIGYSLFYDVKDIMVQLLDGSRIFARVLSATTNVDGNEVLNLEAAIGVDFALADIDLVCFMALVRFDTDRIEIAHGPAGRASASGVVIEVEA